MLTKEEAIKHIDAMIINSKIVRGIVPDEYDIKALTMAIEALEKVSVYEQIKWERDEALATLESHGIGLGQEVKLKCSEKPNSSDLISRQDAVEAVNNYCTSLMDIKRAICALPSAESTGAMDEAIRHYIEEGYMQPVKKTGEWIPARERLPDPGETVLVFMPNNKQAWEEQRCIEFGRISGRKDGEWEWLNESACDYWERAHGEIVAWMPVPEPYKGGDTE